MNTVHGRQPAWIQVDQLGVEQSLARAHATLMGGGIVAFPTGSYYGLGALADNEAAVERLAAAKRRDVEKPIALVAGGRRDVLRLGPLAGPLAALTERFWPGPLTVAMKVTGPWPAPLSAGTGTIGVRVPRHAVARAVVQAGGGLVTASSANRSGAEPAVTAQALDPDLLAYVDLVLDAGACSGGLPSTVVVEDAGGRAVVAREGAISAAALAQVLGYTPAASPLVTDPRRES